MNLGNFEIGLPDYMTCTMKQRQTGLIIVLALSFLLAVSAGVFAQSSSTGASGLTVPRFVSLKSDRVNVRIGPSREHNIGWTFVQAGLPVEIIQEFENWRRIRDWEGKVGWVFHSLLLRVFLCILSQFLCVVWFTIKCLNRDLYSTTVYVNGTVSNEFLHSRFCGTRTGSLALGQEQDSVGGGFDPNQATDAIIDTFAIYDRAWSAEEVG